MSEIPFAIKLIQPIIFGSETISTVSIRPPKAKDFNGIDIVKLSHGEIARRLLSRLSCLPDVVLAEMDANDFFRCMEVAYDFLDASRGITRTAWDSSPTPSTSSPANSQNSQQMTSISGFNRLNESEHIET